MKKEVRKILLVNLRGGRSSFNYLLIVLVLILSLIIIYSGFVFGLGSSQSGDTNLTIWDTSDSQTIYANYSKFYANYTNVTSGDSINGSGIWCEFKHNKTNSWKDLINMSFNPATLQYELTADGGYIQNSTESHRDGMPYGNYSFNVTCYNNLGYYNLSVVDEISVSEYTTSLAIENDTGKLEGEQVYFYANYTSTLMPVSGVGLNNYEIGQIIWNTNDIGDFALSVRYADLDNDGKKDEIVVEEIGSLNAFYENGTSMWVATEITGFATELVVADLDNDTYFNEIVVSDAGYIWVFNESGDDVWNTGAIGTHVRSVVVGDLDSDGLNDDIVAVWRDGTNNKVGVWNTSDGTTWVHLWNATLGGNDDTASEVIISDLDRDGDNDVATITLGAVDTGFAFIGDNGSSIWNVSLGEAIDSLVAVDLDDDKYADEVIFGRTGILYGFEFNGTYGAAYTAGDTIFSNSDPIAHIYELAVADVDGDGLVDDIITGDEGSYDAGPGIIWAFDNNSNQLWNFSIPTNVLDEDEIYSLFVSDVNDDGVKEIVFSSENNDMILILNISGNLLWKYAIGLGNIGGSVGKNPGLSASDINKDGINDIAVASQDGYAHIFQSVTCKAYFDDSTSYNMTWNDTIRKWDMNRSFASAGDYDWNVTCEKGGYVSQVESGVITIMSEDNEYPQFSNYWDDNATLIDSGTGNFNVTIINTNGTVLLEIDNTNITAYNTTASVFNVTYDFTDSGTYAYRWHSWGNGSSENYNVSEERSYIVNASVDSTAPNINFTSPTPDNDSSQLANAVYVNVSTSDANNHSAWIDWNRSLVLWMSFDSRKNATYIYDNSSYGNNGTSYGDANYTAAGKRGGAFQFSGQEPSYIDLPDTTISSVSDEITLSAWFKLDAIPGTSADSDCIISVGASSDGEAGAYLRFSGLTSVLLSLGNGSLRDSNSITISSLNVGDWYHIVAVANLSNKEIYINGNYEGNDAVSLTGSFNNPSLTNHFIGSRAIFSDEFNGTIDEVMIWNRALSPEEINASYNAGLYKLYKNFTDLDLGSYDYTAYTIDAAGNTNQTEERTVTITEDNEYPQFSNYWDDNATLIDSGTGNFNVTIINTNGTVLLEINDTNITAYNTTASVFNVTYDFTDSGTYAYRWHSWGNGSSENYNVSEERSYIVNASVDSTAPTVNLVAPINNSEWNSSSTVTFSYNVSDNSSIDNCSLILNGAINQTDSSITKDTNQIFNQILSNGNYNWSINCTDNSNNVGASEIFNLSVNFTTNVTIYYVDFENGNDSNSGTSNTSAWKRVPGDDNYEGSGNLGAGNTVYFKKGVTYYGQITTTSDNVSYTITNWGVGEAIINGSGEDSCFRVMNNNIIIDGGANKGLVITGSVNHAGIWNYNTSDLFGSTFTNLKIFQIGNSSSDEGIGIKIGGNSYAYTNYVISNNNISYCYSAGIKISGSGTKNINIYNNLIEYCGDKTGEDTQVNLSSNAGEGVQNVTFHSNIIRNGPGNANGINCNNANNSIYNNSIYNNGGYGMSLSPNYNINYGGIIRVYMNKIYSNSNQGIIVGSAGSDRYARIYNNLIWNNTDYAINMQSTSSNNEIYSNSIYMGVGGHGIIIQSGSSGNTIKDNAIWINTGYTIRDESGDIAEDYNCLYTGGVNTVMWDTNLYSNINTYRTASGQGNNSMWQDCLFLDPSNEDFHLQLNSPAIDNGTDLSAYFTDDYEETTRPIDGDNNGSAEWDIGAYEYTSTNITSVLSSPSNGSTDSDGNITFECNATATNSQIANISLYTNYTTWHLNQTNSVSGTSNSTTFTLNNIPNGTSILWNCLACNDENDCNFTSSNWTVSVSLTPTYYIDPSGSDSSGDGSVGNPWYNLSYACSQITTSGDKIYINAGDYADADDCVLAVGVSIEGAGKDLVTINCSVGTPTYSGYITGVSVSETTGNHEISGFTIDGGDTSGLWGIRTRERHNVEIHDMGINNFLGRGVSVEGEPDTGGGVCNAEPAYYATGISIHDNTFTNASWGQTEPDLHYGSLRVESLVGATIYNNIFDETSANSGVGIKLAQCGWMNNVDIYNNTISTLTTDANSFVLEVYNFVNDSKIRDNIFNGPFSLNGGLPTKVSGSDWNLQIYNNTFDMSASTEETFIELSHHWLDFYNNYVIGNPTYIRGVGIWTTNYLTSSSVDHVRIRNNVVFNTTETSIYLSGNAVSFDSIEIYNNVVDTVNLVSWGGWGIGIVGNAVVTNLTVHNNIILNVEDYWLYLQVGVDGAVVTDNMQYGNGRSSGHYDIGSNNNVSNNSNTNPDIVASGDRPEYYYPSSGSSNLVDTGISLTGENDEDYGGTSRPIDGDNNGSAEWDIGAYEYTPTNITVTLESPSNNFSTSNTTIIFNCSAIDNLNLANITLYGNWSGGWHANETTSITGTSNSTTFTKTLSIGNYIWNCLAYDNDSNLDWGNSNYTLSITAAPDNEYPQFSNYWDDNATLEDSGTGNFNVTIINTNGTVLLEINNTNITAYNTTASVFNVTYDFTDSGTYSYRWHSWGNGTNENYNVSGERSYIVNDTIAPSISIEYPSNNSNFTTNLININYTISSAQSCWYSNDTYSSNTTITCGENITTVTWLEGQHNVTVWANDSAGNENSSSVTFFVDSINPTINFTLPTETNGDFVSRNYIQINVTSTDTNLNTILIRLYNSSSGLVNSSNTSSSPNYINFSGLTDGIYYYNATANDTLGNSNDTATRNITIDLTNSVISLVSPSNNSESSSTNITFIYNVTDTNSVSNCSLIINGTLNQTDTSITKDTNQTFNLILSNANYNWSINCTDNSNNVGASEIFNFSVSDTTSPNITLISPTNSSTQTSSSTVTFSYNVSDDSSINNCSLLVNHVIDQTDTTITKDTTQIFLKSLSNANYNWSVNCYDFAENQGNSSLYYLTVSYTAPVDETPSGGGGGGSAVIITNTTETSETFTVITPGNVTIMKDFDLETGIKQIQIEVNKEAQNVKITVTKYSDKPANVSVEKSGKVYRYLQIQEENLNESLDKAIVEIQVSKNWTIENNIEKEDISMFKFNESYYVWNELETTFIESPIRDDLDSPDEEYYYYEVELNSFSYFAIAGKSLIEETEEVEETGLMEKIKEIFWRAIEVAKRAVEFVKIYWKWFSVGVGSFVIVVAGVVLGLKKFKGKVSKSGKKAKKGKGEKVKGKSSKKVGRIKRKGKVSKKDEKRVKGGQISKRK